MLDLVLLSTIIHAFGNKIEDIVYYGKKTHYESSYTF